MRLYTIGHSTRTLDEFVSALRSFGVNTLADIRTVPRSRHVPQFNRESLSRTLPRRGIRYRHIQALGGLRRPRADSRHTGWRNASFRGFADYMETPEFASALEELRALAREMGPVAVMCAEAVPWRCHRSLVADGLIARGDTVIHIMGPGKGSPHALTPWAHVDSGRVTYPGPPPGRVGTPGVIDQGRPRETLNRVGTSDRFGTPGDPGTAPASRPRPSPAPGRPRRSRGGTEPRPPAAPY